MGLAGVLSVFVVKKQEKPWEVVDSKAVEPVALFDEEDGARALLPPSERFLLTYRRSRHHICSRDAGRPHLCI
jgi:hypothetical protein